MGEYPGMVQRVYQSKPVQLVSTVEVRLLTVTSFSFERLFEETGGH